MAEEIRSTALAVAAKEAGSESLVKSPECAIAKAASSLLNVPDGPCSHSTKSGGSPDNSSRRGAR